MTPPPGDAPLSSIQRTLLHDALRSIRSAQERLESMKLLQRYAGQPKVVRACTEMQAALQNIWHLLDGLDH